MNLAQIQQRFLSGIADTAEGKPAKDCPWEDQGYSIYRNAYRTTLIEALKETFPKTLAYVGDGPFNHAAAHFVISQPPSSWSLDHLGAGFEDCLAELFAANPEVSQIARLEWALHLAFVLPDQKPMTQAELAEASSRFTDEDWHQMRLDFVSFVEFPCTFDLAAWWQDTSNAPEKLEDPRHTIVWCEAEQPVFLLVKALEAESLLAMKRGASFGEICANLRGEPDGGDGVGAAAAILRHWLDCGLVAAVCHR